MSGGMWKFSQIKDLAPKFPAVRNGIVADTNIIFAGSYDLDHFNSEVADFMIDIRELEIPLYTNVNIRTEFLDLHRRVLIAECLIDMYEGAAKDMSSGLAHQLKSLRTRYRTAIDEGRVFKLSDKEIKNFRNYLIPSSAGDQDGWEIFCENCFLDKMAVVWDVAVRELGLNTLSLREGERSPRVTGDISWEEMVKLVGRFGIGVSDAMILNLFLNSNFGALVTADLDAVYCLDKLKWSDKVVIIPDSLQV
jgi:hypothetical protein